MSAVPDRRRFLKLSAGVPAAVGSLCAVPTAVQAEQPTAESRQAMGTRVGEMTPESAVVWIRLTESSGRRADGKTFARTKKGDVDDPRADPREFEGACPGAPGRVRLKNWSRADASNAVTTDWVDVGESTDFTHHFRLKALTPGTAYQYVTESAGPEGKPQHGSRSGRFRTAPSIDQVEPITFCVMTCQGYHDRGHRDGHPIYPAMTAVNPHFAVMTGDLVYYDNDGPRAVTPALARYQWQRMFSLPRIRDFTSSFGAYWLKDDHDTLSDDSWPGRKAGDFTFEEGQRIFRQQAPMIDGPSYRTFRWGADLQVWFTDGRDHRSPNSMKDGPTKTIWGAEQKAWFQKTVKESNARWKVLVSPTPLVGPDRKNKNDNHANEGFKHEGDEIRGWLKATVPDNFFVVCGDRHWQYHSVHPVTGLNEFSVGPASDEHSGGTPGENKEYHRFHRVKGGFLSVRIDRTAGRPAVRFQLHDVGGAVVYKKEFGG